MAASATGNYAFTGYMPILAILDVTPFGYHQVPVGLNSATFHLLRSQRCIETPRVGAGNARKRYALRRLRLATHRLMLANSDIEEILATRWVNAWAGATGDRQFSTIVE